MTHIPIKEHKKLTGTTRYASINTHNGIEQSRRDDMECLSYTLIYLAKGELPWQGIQAKNKGDKYEKIRKIKENTSIDILCKGLPYPFSRLLTYCKSSKFEDKIGYEQLKVMFKECFYESKHDKNFEFDWIKLRVDVSLDFPKKEAQMEQI